MLRPGISGIQNSKSDIRRVNQGGLRGGLISPELFNYYYSGISHPIDGIEIITMQFLLSQLKMRAASANRVASIRIGLDLKIFSPYACITMDPTYTGRFLLGFGVKSKTRLDTNQNECSSMSS